MALICGRPSVDVAFLGEDAMIRVLPEKHRVEVRKELDRDCSGYRLFCIIPATIPEPYRGGLTPQLHCWPGNGKPPIPWQVEGRSGYGDLVLSERQASPFGLVHMSYRQYHVY